MIIRYVHLIEVLTTSVKGSFSKCLVMPWREVNLSQKPIKWGVMWDDGLYILSVPPRKSASDNMRRGCFTFPSMRACASNCRRHLREARAYCRDDVRAPLLEHHRDFILNSLFQQSA